MKYTVGDSVKLIKPDGGGNWNAAGHMDYLDQKIVLLEQGAFDLGDDMWLIEGNWIVKEEDMELVSGVSTKDASKAYEHAMGVIE